ncbi:MAG TPA: hypothetical protein VGH28_31535 [Polyangiaceae bacterium]|jgi:hypothetical protein
MRLRFVLVCLIVAACGGDDNVSVFDAGGDGDASITPFDGGFEASGGDGAPSTFTDFGDPIVVAGDAGPSAPSNAQQLFGDSDAGAPSGGPCLVEPEVGSLYPHNWLRPRFRFVASAGENLFEIRLHAPNQTKDLLVYTTETSWTMPKAMWDLVRDHSNDMPLTLTVRGGAFDGTNLTNVALGSNGTIGIAPVDAPGSIVYWFTDGYSGAIGLNGFSVGDESVVSALTTPQVQEQSISCMGCHTGTPDGASVVISTTNGGWGNMLASVDPGDGGAAGVVPSYAGNAGLAALLAGPLGISTISKAHWQTGDRVVVASNNTDLQWIDVEATSAANARGTIARNGTQTPGALAGSPSFSHDGNTIVYTATNHTADGRLGGYYLDTDDTGSRADLYTVPFANRAGGTIAPVAGASDPNVQEFYPSYSPDDALIAFAEAPNDKNMYNQPLAEVYVIPAGGGTATRLAANDPPSCSGVASPGVTNTWPKWAPSVGTASGGRSFYWIVFSSTRIGALPQLFITPVVVSNGSIQTYASLYLWNQPANQGNHTPAWDYFKISSPPPN